MKRATTRKKSRLKQLILQAYLQINATPRIPLLNRLLKTDLKAAAQRVPNFATTGRKQSLRALGTVTLRYQDQRDSLNVGKHATGE